MQAEDVRTQTDLLEYLGRSARDTYLEGTGSDVSQTTTFLKTYIVERHLLEDGAEPIWSPTFGEHDSLDDHITRLRTKKKLVFFSERLNRRFCMLHTIEKTAETDAVVSRLTRGVNSWTDRAWMPSSFMLGSRVGLLVGYKLASDIERNIDLMGDQDDVVEVDIDDDAIMPTDEVEDSPKGFRVSSASPMFAAKDLNEIMSSRIYADRRSVDWIDTRSHLNDNVWLHSTTYSNGKIISRTPSPESHVAEVRRVAELYGQVVQGIEENYAIRWSSGPSGTVRLGEALLLEFLDYELPNLEYFTESVFSGISGLGLLGVPTFRNEHRVDVEAVDLHRGDTVSFEITRNWIRIYLPEHSCGNVVCRFVWNLQRYFSSSLRMTASSGEVLFSEGTV